MCRRAPSLTRFAGLLLFATGVAHEVVLEDSNAGHPCDASLVTPAPFAKPKTAAFVANAVIASGSGGDCHAAWERATVNELTFGRGLNKTYVDDSLWWLYHGHAIDEFRQRFPDFEATEALPTGTFQPSLNCGDCMLTDN